MSRLEEIQALVDEWKAVQSEYNATQPMRHHKLLMLMAEEMLEQERMRELVQNLVDQINAKADPGPYYLRQRRVSLVDLVTQQRRHFIPDYGSEGEY